MAICVGVAVSGALGDTVGISFGITGSDMDGEGIRLAMGDAVGHTVGLSEGFTVGGVTVDDI